MSDVRTLDADALAEAKRVIERADLVVLPTDTVYGIACDPRNAEALERLYQAKGRAHTKALQVLLASVDDLDALGLTLPSPLDTLASTLLPGGLSLIAQADETCTLGTLADDRTQAIRVPDCEALHRILEVTGPLAASSANRSGEDAARTAEEAHAALGDAVDLVIDAGPAAAGEASTVVAADPAGRDGIAILREGAVSRDAIHAALAAHEGRLAA